MAKGFPADIDSAWGLTDERVPDYEFLVIDRARGKEQLADLRALSTRATSEPNTAGWRLGCHYLV